MYMWTIPPYIQRDLNFEPAYTNEISYRHGYYYYQKLTVKKVKISMLNLCKKLTKGRKGELEGMQSRGQEGNKGDHFCLCVLCPSDIKFENFNVVVS